MSLEFIGVYATSERPVVSGGFPRPTVLRKRLWFVWAAPDQTYNVQALNAALLPMAEGRSITAKEFKERFTREVACEAVPEGHEKAQEDTALDEMALPDLFSALGSTAEVELFSPGSGEAVECLAEARLNASDPCLLQAWLKDGPPAVQPSEDASKIPFDSLMGQVQEEAESPPSSAIPSLMDMVDGAAPDAGEVEQVRFLRSKFVQALLLLRRGERHESTALLRGVLSQSYPPFEGGAQLFSEFGLGLRRLGLISLALLAHKRALEFAPHDARVLFNIARSYHDLDYLSEARDYLKEALAADPDFAQARQFLSFLEIKEPGGK